MAMFLRGTFDDPPGLVWVTDPAALEVILAFGEIRLGDLLWEQLRAPVQPNDMGLIVRIDHKIEIHRQLSYHRALHDTAWKLVGWARPA